VTEERESRHNDVVVTGPGDVAGIHVDDAGVARCWWGAEDAQYQQYHDLEWGRPVADDRRLFETLCLEGFQAGLSWITILRKRSNFHAAFDDFDLERVARFDANKIEQLMADVGIVRNRAKIEATINNARRCLELGSLAAYVWGFEPDAASRPTVLDHAALMQIRTSPEAVAMSKDLRRRAWAFVGPTTIYAFMQAVGLVNDHLDACAFRAEAERDRNAFQRPR
jgi:DNA-3-methyladenine glycosylase I